MLYNSTLTKMLDEVFTFPYGLVTDNAFVIDSIKTEKDGSAKITVVVPGYAKEDLDLQVSNNTLTLSSSDESKKFNRSWKLSEWVDLKNISAECKNGVLTVVLPVKQKTEKVLSVSIK